MARDPKSARAGSRLAATQGQPYAEYRIAALYERGVGVTKDLRTGARVVPEGGGRRQRARDAQSRRHKRRGRPAPASPTTRRRRRASAAPPNSGCATASSTSACSTAAASACPGSRCPGCVSRSPPSRATRTPPRSATKSPLKMDAKTLAAAQKKLADFKAENPVGPAANETPAPPGGWDGAAASPQVAKSCNRPTPARRPQRSDAKVARPASPARVFFLDRGVFAATPRIRRPKAPRALVRLPG